MRNIPKPSHVLVTSILAVLALYAACGTAFAYSYIVRDFQDRIPAPGPDPIYKNNQVPKGWRLAIPANLPGGRIKGILMIGNATGPDTRDWYSTNPFYQEFINMYGFAFIGSATLPPGRWDPSHQEVIIMFQHALQHWTDPSSPDYCGHPELINAPIVSTGVSTGGGFASRLATNLPEQYKMLAVVPCVTRLDLDALNHPQINSTLFDMPILPIVGDYGGQYKDANLETWRPAPYNARWGTVSTQGVGDAYCGQEVLAMPYLEKAVRLRYPDGGDPSKGPLKLNTLDPKSGWVADNTTWGSGLTSISPAASFTGNISKTSWLMDKDLAYIYRAFATYDSTPGANLLDRNSPRQIKMTSPAMSEWGCPVQDPGNVTIKVDASIFAKNFPGWTKLEFYDDSTLLGTVTPPETSPSLTANIQQVGYHVFSVLGYDANGNAVRTSNPTMVIVRGTYQYPKGTGSSPKPEPCLASNPGFESGTLTPGWTAASGKTTIITDGAFSGLYSAKTSGNGSGFQQKITGLSPKTTYYAQAWTKSGDGTTQAAIGVSGYGGSTVSRSTSSTAWTRLTFRFTTDVRHATADIWCRIPAGSGDAYFDDFTVSTQPMSVFVSISTFEGGTLTDNWPTTSGTNMIVKDDNPHTGQYCVKSSGNGSRFQQTITDLSPNTTYHGEAWVRSSNATASVGASGCGGSPVTVSTTKTGWTFVTFTFKTDARNTTADIWCGVTSGAGDGYFDDVSVY